MRGAWFKLQAKPEVLELWVYNMKDTGIPNTGWPGFIVFELTLWGNIVTLSLGFCFQLYPRHERLEEIAENLNTIRRKKDEQSVTK